nr:PepSY domain-containing protein [uncultured Ligilactobacillus sp.]
MKKNHKLALLGATLSLSTGLLFLGSATVNADETINADKYTQDVNELQKIFTNKNKNYSLEEITVENNKENTKQPVYKLEGFNSKKSKEAKMKVNAEKTSEVIKNKTEKMDADDKKDAVAIKTDDVKKNPTDAINLAKKYADVTSNATEWKLEMDKVKGKETPVYKVEFENAQKSTKSSTNSNKKSSSKKDKDDKKIVVKLNATTGDKISVKTDD